MSKIQGLRVLVKQFLSATAEEIVEAVEKSKIQDPRVLVKQFLSAAADEIVEAVEKMMAGYEEEMFQSKREISQQRKMLDALLQPEIKLNRIAEEAQLTLSVWEEDFQEWNSSPRQKNPESPKTERSHKEPLSSSQDRRPEDDTTYDTFTPQCEEQEIDKKEEEPLPVTSAEQMPIETDEEVPSPGLSEAENGEEDEDWQLSDASQDTDSDRSEANQDGHSDSSEEWSNSGQHRTQTAKTPRMKKKQKSSIICKVCGKSFWTQVALVNHLDVHPKDFCGLCGRHFETEEDLKLHLKTHKSLQARVCNVCGKCFGSPSALEIHMRTHTGVKPFSCSVCGKCFTLRHQMTRHLRVHTGEKPYSCKTCNKSFSDKRHNCLQEKTPAVSTPAVDDGDGNAEAKDSTAQVTRGNRVKVCEICGKQNSDMKSHMRTHTGDKPFSCSECGKSFRVRQHMTRHLRIHTGEKPYPCSTCNKRFSDISFLKRHKCLQDKILAITTPAVDDGDGDAEVKDSTAQQQLLYICKVCGKEFRSQVSLVNHLDIHPKDFCGLCGRHFETEEDLKLHVKTHKSLQARVCNVCGKCSGSQSALEIHMRTHTGVKPFSCSVCGKCFTLRHQMTRHLRVHTGEKPYSCKTCNKSFSEKRHNCFQEKTPAVSTPAVDDGDGNAEAKDSTAQVTHDNRLKVCEICGKQSSHLESHMRTHTGDKPFSCSVCGKAFRVRQHMTRHLRIHTGEKPYSCSTCNKRFSDISSLKRHKCLQDKILAVTTPAVDDGDDDAEVKDSTAQQQLLYICKVCGKEFLSMVSLVNHAKTHTEDLLCGVCGTRPDSGESLKLHLKTHTSYRKLCKICGKCFRDKAHLEDHMRLHTGMKPFGCSVCGKSFRLRQCLIKHAKIHTGGKPYSCNSCNKCYSRKSYFKRHKCCSQKNTLAVTTQAVEDGDDDAEGE